ncbi:alpha/beta fold hydrolase [Nocardia suismassiliense]|uniref:alpha/beta fold hydrolase n=1 Tax=Nocardia suismassiliense TaxID=2077092 RepID=UPI000D1FC7EC|nr:alpha/beta fold hydrolase [Nocardia suismassiliense]
MTKSTTPARTLTATDGIEIAVYEAGPPEGPTVVLIHGYPDDHHVWDGVVTLLADRFHVVTYDVRGAGNSGRPKNTAAYRISQLIEDLHTVLATTAPDGAHVLAHDWGSICVWEAVTDPRFATGIHSLTSISGPSLDMLGVWMRRVRHHPRAIAAQLRRSAYTLAFQLPVVPELAVKAGLVARVVAASSRPGEPAGTPAHTVTVGDAVDGIGLYRANLARRVLRPRPRSTVIPVLVLAPVDDVNISVAAQTEPPAPFAANLRTQQIEGNHWVITQRPAVVAERFTTFIDDLAGSR